MISNKRDSINKFSEKFLESLIKLFIEYVDSSLIDDFIYSLEKNLIRFPNNNETESNLYRILSSRYDKGSFVYNSINYPIYSHLLIAIASSSNYLTDILIKDPEYFYSLTNTSVLQRKIDGVTFTIETKKMLSVFSSFEAKLNSLKSLKRKETLRIGVNDILGYSDIKTTIYQLSILSKAITAKLFTICYLTTLEKYKIKKIKCKYVLIALGKLGGDELNYSSDIDLILLFDKNISVNKKEYFEILSEAIQLFTKSSNTITEDGFLYRIDFRLRPDGKTSPLCRTLTDTLHYYETRGEDWERQMLIKASYVTGDSKLYNEFINYLTPFIYPKNFKRSPAEQIKKMKSEIEGKLSDDKNIKLIKGGIRDIEFSIQALQLLNGGKVKDIRTGNTLEAIRKLKINNLISEKEANTLHSAYYFYRKIEHYQQLRNDRQTHDIPEDRTKLYTLSLYLGFRNTIEFETILNNTRNDIRNIYDSIVLSKQNENADNNKLGQIKFTDTKNAHHNLEYLENGIGISNQKQFDITTSRAYLEIEELILENLQISNSPDKLLNNFVKIIRQVKFPSIWFKELKDKNFAKGVFLICEYSNKTIDLILDNPKFIDIILSKKVFQTISNKDFNKLNLNELLLIITFQFTIGKISHTKFSYLLSSYLKNKIDDLANNYLGTNVEKDNYLVAGMGSFSINEMSFISDIDLIFIASNSDQSNYTEKIFQNFLTDLNKLFKPFKVDCRLRPEGKSSQLVWNIEGYQNYINSRVQIWELQSLCKINYISGSKKIFNKLIKSIDQKIANTNPNKIKEEMRLMRKRLYPISYTAGNSIFDTKLNPGGLLDIDFIVQYLILSRKLSYKKCHGYSITKILDQLIKIKQNKKQLIELKNNYNFLKNIVLVSQNIFNDRTYKLSDNKNERNTINKFIRYDNINFEDKISELIKFNKLMLNKIFS